MYEIALTAAWLSSFSLALMVVFDRLMVGDCYRNRADQAWFVASLSGLVFGVLFTLVVWTVYAVFADHSWWHFFTQIHSVFYPTGILMILAGACTIQVLRHYFWMFIPEREEQVSETGIAMWLASTPIFIFLAIAGLQATEWQIPLFSGLEEANVSWQFGLLVVITALCFIKFEAVNQPERLPLRPRYYRQICLLMLFTVIYSIILSGVLRATPGDIPTVLPLLALYWVGFAAGLRVMANETERKALRKNWGRIKLFAIPILVVEVIGMLVFFFEFFGLSGIDPTLVNLIIGAHVLLVFLLTLGLRRVRAHLERSGQQRVWVLGLRLAKHKLPEQHGRVSVEIAWLTLAVSSLLVTLFLF